MNQPFYHYYRFDKVHSIISPCPPPLVIIRIPIPAHNITEKPNQNTEENSIKYLPFMLVMHVNSSSKRYEVELQLALWYRIREKWGFS